MPFLYQLWTSAKVWAESVDEQAHCCICASAAVEVFVTSRHSDPLFCAANS
jgi:hypothetical protein